MDDDDWDLSAVVRSCRPSGEATATRNRLWAFPRPLEHLWVMADEKRGACISISEAYESRSGVLGKEGGSLSPLSAAVLSSGAMVEPKSNQPPLRGKVGRTASQTSRFLRRKNQQKKVVRHVTVDGLSSDVWAWRKYGQKPIKGSPYPRGYYRCSSSKDCTARKQVERSRTDPEAFIVTYTGEHKHPKPTHRNSLAGSTRPKLPTTPAANHEAIASPLSTIAALELLPTPRLSDSILLRRNKCGDEGVEEEEEEEIEMEDEEEAGELLVEDMEMMGEDDLLFMSSEEGTGGSPTADMVALFDGDGGFGDPLFPLPLQSSKGESNNTTTTACEAVSAS
ncbi:WRKY transcription factor 22-like [Curcuma longa]|uniref:WRKY transcription factor 22-like n=1 Tax=Curcuma longa TaxID=136217 RepID=UPI003D9E63A1